MKFKTNHPSCFLCSPTSLCARCALALFDLMEGTLIEKQLQNGTHPKVTPVTIRDEACPCCGDPVDPCSCARCDKCPCRNADEKMKFCKPVQDGTMWGVPVLQCNGEEWEEGMWHHPKCFLHGAREGC